MSLLLAIVGLPLALFLPGLCTLVLWAPLRRLDWLERIYLSLAISLALSGWLGLVLAQLGCFSMGLLLGLLALYVLTLALWAWRRGRWSWPRPASSGAPLLLAALGLVLLFGLLALPPFELILGPRDAAVYPATGMQIVEQGSLRFDDPIVPTLQRSSPQEQERLWSHFFLFQHPERFYYEYARMPGFFIADAEEGTVVPQFYHLYPTWLAIAFGLVGLKAGLLMTPFLSLLGGLGLLVVARRLFGRWVALLATLFLLLNALQVWFARYSTAEGATQFLLFFGIYGLLRLEEGVGLLRLEGSARRGAAAGASADGSAFFGLLAGGALGLVGLVRADFLFPWLLLLPYLAYLFVTRRMQRGHRLFVAAGGVLALHTIVQIVTHTRAYTLALYYHRIQDWTTLSWLIQPLLTPTLRAAYGWRTPVMQQTWRLFAEPGALLLGLGFLVWLRRSPRGGARIEGWARRHRRLLLALAAGLFLLAAAYAYLVRPAILTGEVLRHPLRYRMELEGYFGAPIPEGPAGNLVRLGWYLSPLGIALGVVGIAAMVLYKTSRRSLYLLSLGIFYTALFTYEVYGVPHHVYIMRRYIPMVVPFFCLGMAFALVRLARFGRLRWVGPALAGGMALLMVVYLVYTGLPFYRHTEYRGAIDQIEDLAGRFEPDDVLILLNNARDAPFAVAVPLQYLFDRQALVLIHLAPDGRLVEEQIARWQQQGRQVYLLAGNGGGRLFLPHTRLQWRDRFELAVPEFEQLTAQKPHNAYILRLPFGIYAPTAWSGAGSLLGDLPLRIDVGREGYVHQVGGFHQDEVAPDGTSFCWTTGEGELRLPWPEGSGMVTLTLRLAGGRRPPELGAAEVEALLQGESVARWTLQEAFTTHQLSLAVESVEPGAGQTVLLTLRSPSWRQVDYGLGGDYRPLGIEVDWVQVVTTSR